MEASATCFSTYLTRCFLNLSPDFMSEHLLSLWNYGYCTSVFFFPPQCSYDITCITTFFTFHFNDPVLYHCVLLRIHLHLQPVPAGLPSLLGQTVSEDLPSEAQCLQPGHAHVSLWHPGHLGQECTWRQVRLAVLHPSWHLLLDQSDPKPASSLL